MKRITAEAMRDLDFRTIRECGIPGHVLMERAGVGAAEILLDYLSELDPRHVRRIVHLVGKGNNGGDALVVARILAERSPGLRQRILSVVPLCEMSGDARLNAERLPGGIERLSPKTIEIEMFRPGDVLVDGLLGTGASGPLRPPCDQWIRTLEFLGLPTIALDIPSGLDANDGSVATAAVRADLTVSIGLPKVGLSRGDGPIRCGRIRHVDIGIPQELLRTVPDQGELIVADDVRRMLHGILRISPDIHKVARGRVAVVGGSKQYPGAPWLAGCAALRSGAGLVTVAVPDSAPNWGSPRLSLLRRGIPDDGSGNFSKRSLAEIGELAESCDALVFGPGLGRAHTLKAVVENTLALSVSKIVDADALNVLADHPDLWQPNSAAKTILTPHPGEMRRLLAGFGMHEVLDTERNVQAASLAAKLGAVVVLKGNQTVTAAPDGRIAINASGSTALATAGTGDVLTGVIAAWIKPLSDPFEAAVVGVFLHGLAGELSPFGTRGLTADDLCDLIPPAMKRLTPFA
jgi:NAD(P)H-hydrate epimerase